MKIFFVGDIVGEPGREILKEKLPDFIKENRINFVIANAENAAGGKGLTDKVAEEIFSSGVNVITLGNHTFARKEIELIINDKRILRPANYPPEVPGNRYGIYYVEGFTSPVGVINFMGRVYMPLLDCPFRTSEEIIKEISKETKIIVVDFHAEITSEKLAFGWFLDGKVSAVIGTHTHVQTADERILPQGTAYITDCGMAGPKDGIIGMDKEIVLKRYLTAMPFRFVVSKGDNILNGCIIEIDEITGKATDIKRISYV
ncbi:MAG: TIGR00282 family metallophosphoesterase [Endomicrobiia bacterium]